MGIVRPVRKVMGSRPTVEGAGVRLRRAIGFGDPAEFDPFLLLDDFRSDDPGDYRPGFPWHPHRGIETITYVLAGEVEHRDSLGNRGVIGPGDLQWMTAGGGIVHQEMPKGDGRGSMHGFQLWANLPARDKMMEPRYRGLTAPDIPVVEGAGGVTVRIIAGMFGGVRGPVRDVVTSPSYLDISLSPGGELTQPVPRGHTCFAYVIGGGVVFARQSDPYSYEAEGAGWFETGRKTPIEDRHLVAFGEGDQVTAAAGGEGARFLLVSGKPIGEPIAWYGPIVMNTREELRQAYEELEKGTFLAREGRS